MAAKSANTFSTARKNLENLLSNLTFLQVVMIQKTGNTFTGEAVEIINGQQKRLVFFDKFGRSRTFLTVGPITLTQAPLGFDHPSSVPSVGEILVGTLVPNARKSHLTHVLRGWSSDAKCLQELLRLVRHGTKRSEFENRDILLQPAGLLLSSPMNLRIYRDEVYLLARIILWGNVRPLQVLATIQKDHFKLKKEATDTEILAAKQMCISVSAVDFVDLITVKLSTNEISEAFMEGLEIVPTSPKEECVKATKQESHMFYTGFHQSQAFKSEAQVSSPKYQVSSPKSPTYKNSSPKQSASSPKSPTYKVSSASSPKNQESHSPPYNPTSPTYDFDE